jgi:hypothetical protein
MNIKNMGLIKNPIADSKALVMEIWKSGFLCYVVAKYLLRLSATIFKIRKSINKLLMFNHLDEEKLFFIKSKVWSMQHRLR